MSNQDVTAAPLWRPTKQVIESTNIYQFMREQGLDSVPALHAWSVRQIDTFWQQVVKRLGITFNKQPEAICDISHGFEQPIWFPGSMLNIASSCFQAKPSMLALIYLDHHNHLGTMTYGELDQLSNQIANGFVSAGYSPGDAIGIAMPMNPFAVASYLGILKMGGVVVSIADSFSTQEMETRLSIAKTACVITQDYSHWNQKQHPLYEKVANTSVKQIICLRTSTPSACSLRQGDLEWDQFISDNKQFKPISVQPMTPCNILFSSGTTGTPKAIVWNHTTPIKAASDGYFHQNIQSGDRIAWPTNLGWMMGPWLIFASLINQATLVLYTEVPKDRHFGDFIEKSQTTMLGVVPTLVAHWKQTKCMETVNWSRIKRFSSTGECSNPADMTYLSSLAGHKPIIEYCGGTEIGGAFLSSTMMQDNYASQFTTPTIGLNLAILNEQGKRDNHGEIAIIPPSIGLSTTLLNADHHHVYFENMPLYDDGRPLRRHGDEVIKLDHGNYIILGRIDDTMNLGGIKVSSAEIERTLSNLTGITETAAIAVNPPGNGPSLLVIFAVCSSSLNKDAAMKDMQRLINANLNPLFKIHDLVIVKELPRTASNKVMRRVLRDNYQHPSR